ncbi:hypothetical protein AL525_003580 [Citrobacter amalonaticus]|nr:hypothetical protein AL525_003580 [Citrobacter amalonaticus]
MQIIFNQSANLELCHFEYTGSAYLLKKHLLILKKILLLRPPSKSISENLMNSNYNPKKINEIVGKVLHKCG